jgi:hypothetical protein
MLRNFIPVRYLLMCSSFWIDLWVIFPFDEKEEEEEDDEEEEMEDEEDTDEEEEDEDDDIGEEVTYRNMG